MKPTVGRTVHYYGLGQLEPRSATVVSRHPVLDEVDLTVFFAPHDLMSSNSELIAHRSRVRPLAIVDRERDTSEGWAWPPREAAQTTPDVKQIALDAALLMRELVAERIYRERGSWHPEHPNKALRVRELTPDLIVVLMSPEIRKTLQTADKEELKLLAAQLMDIVDKND